MRFHVLQVAPAEVPPAGVTVPGRSHPRWILPGTTRSGICMQQGARPHHGLLLLPGSDGKGGCSAPTHEKVNEGVDKQVVVEHDTLLLSPFCAGRYSAPPARRSHGICCTAGLPMQTVAGQYCCRHVPPD